MNIKLIPLLFLSHVLCYDLTSDSIAWHQSSIVLSTDTNTTASNITLEDPSSNSTTTVQQNAS